jgi:hypothetical protein
VQQTPLGVAQEDTIYLQLAIEAPAEGPVRHEVGPKSGVMEEPENIEIIRFPAVKLQQRHFYLDPENVFEDA